MLVGRDREVRALDGGLAQLAAGQGALHVFAGEPGIGKTRLATEVAAHAAQRGIRVAWGRCWEAGGAPALWPWREAFTALGEVFPEASDILAGDPAQARFALFRRVSTELARVATAGPVVVVLEDLHAADLASVLLLELLVAQLRAMPVMVVGTYRDLEASLRPEIGDVLARAGRAGTLTLLSRLRADDVALVVRDAIDGADDRLVARVFDTTQGNPLFVTEIVQQVRAGDAAVANIPLGVREIIRQRLARISPAARGVLEAAAVLGVELGAGVLARMVTDTARASSLDAGEHAGLGPDAAAAALDVALASGLVTRRGDRVRFAHALYREALYHDLAPATRKALHRDAARALGAAGAANAAVAHHVLESGLSPETIERVIVAARDALDEFAFEDAISLLERARLAITPAPLERSLRARVTIALGEARLRSGDVRGRELCVEGAALARVLGDAELLAFAGLAYGSVFTIGGVDPVMVGMLEEALDKLPAGDTGLRARTMTRLAAARQPSIPALRERDIQLAIAGVELGRRVASRRELLEIFQSASGALYGAADPRDRMPVSRDLATLAEELGDAPRLVAAHVRLAMDYLELGDFAGYAQNADTYEQLAARYGAAANPWRVPLMRSMIALAHDAFAESQRWQSVAAGVDADNPRARRARALHRICFLRATERHAELRASIAELRSLWLALPYGANLADARVASTLMRLGADDELRALLATVPIEAFDEDINLISLADTLWSTRDPVHAERLRAGLARHGSRWFAYWLDVEILELPFERARAFVEAALGNWEAADRWFAEALQLVERLGRRASIARVKFEYGDLLVRAGRDLARAHTLLAEGRAVAVELGLHELVALIDARHGAMPGPSQRAASRRETFAIAREGEYFAVTGSRGTLRFKASRGMHYLAELAARPNTDVHVLDLVGSNEADRGDAGDVTDASALHAYRERIAALRDVVEDAEQRGHGDRAERARAELEALAAELSRGTGLGGKARRSESAVDRARSAVQRRIKDAVDRIGEQDPELGDWLRRVVRTGNHCSFQIV